MPISKKQLQRLIRLVSQLKENRYPNCSTFALAMRKADLDENLNVSDFNPYVAEAYTKTVADTIEIAKQLFHSGFIRTGVPQASSS